MDFDPSKPLSLNQSIWFLVFAFKKLDQRSVKHNSGKNVRVFNLKTQESNVLLFPVIFYLIFVTRIDSDITLCFKQAQD